MKNNRIAISTTVRADKFIIEKFIDYHLSKGISEIYLFLDDPEFNKPIENFTNDSRVVFIICDNKYWQEINNFRFDGSNVNEKPIGIEQRQFSNLQYARNITYCEWMASVDIDELIYSPYDFSDFMGAIPKNVFSIRMRSKEAVYNKRIEKNNIFDTQYFKISNKKNQKQSLKYYPKELRSNGGFWGHTLGKILARTKEPIKYMGNHFLTPVKNDFLVDVELDFLCVLHFEGMCEDSFIDKQLRRMSNAVVVQRLSKREYSRLDHFKNEYNKNGLASLKKLYGLMHVFEPDKLNSALNHKFIERVNFEENYLPYNVGIEDFHFNYLQFSYADNKGVSRGGEAVIKILKLNNKVVLFYKNELSEVITLESDGKYLRSNFSELTKLYEVKESDGFFCICNDSNFLISLESGELRFNSDNLGNWEMFEFKRVDN